MKFTCFYPVKPFEINQPFGTPSPTYTALGLKGHNGIDLKAAHGQPIYATHDGAAYYEVDSNSGHGVIIRTNGTYDYQGGQAYFKTIYWHLCDATKEPQFKSPITATDINGPGQPVKVGDLIGYADNTGISAGDHLHFGIKPQGQNESNGTWWNMEQNNGYAGAIDPVPYLNGFYANDSNKVISAEFAIVASAGNVVANIAKSDIPNAEKISLLAQITSGIKKLFNL